MPVSTRKKDYSQVLEKVPTKKEGGKDEPPKKRTKLLPNIQKIASEYERLREKNIREKEELLRSLDLHQARDELLKTIQTPKRKPSQKPEKGSLEPTRRSLRLQTLEAGYKLDEEDLQQRSPRIHQYQVPSGAFPAQSVLEIFDDDEDDEESKDAILRSYQELLMDSDTSASWHQSTERLRTQMGSFQLEQKLKVCAERIYDVKFHPRSLVAAAGDKSGRLGLYSPHAAGPHRFRPHSSPISCLDFLPQSNLLVSCSYDGSVRCLDVEKAIFDHLYQSEDNDLCKFLAVQSESVVLVTLHNGDLALVDIRQDCKANRQCTYSLCQARLRTVSVHPSDPHIIVTAAFDGNATFWDLRGLRRRQRSQRPMLALPHGKSLQSAFFSPLTGRHLLTSCSSDRITIFNTSAMPTVNTLLTIKHNNHTGRWLTPFRPVWHRANEELFISGSMEAQRVVEVWGLDGGAPQHLPGLSTICSVNAFHPSFPAIVGANSSGYLHIWKA